MKNVFNKWPAAILRRWAISLLIGAACLVVGVATWFSLNDTMLLFLSGAVFVLSICRAVLLYRLVTRKAYEVHQGVCIQVTVCPLRKCRQVKFLDGGGAEFSLLLDKRTKVSIGWIYRFYFKQEQRTLPANLPFRSALAQDQLLGFEALEEYTAVNTAEK